MLLQFEALWNIVKSKLGVKQTVQYSKKTFLTLARRDRENPALPAL
jgi:hypothetical protein